MQFTDKIEAKYVTYMYKHSFLFTNTYKYKTLIFFNFKYTPSFKKFIVGLKVGLRNT